jgi:hypothetical protein
MLEHLFGSRTRVKLLRLFYRESSRNFFVRELTRLTETQINAVRRELAHLTNSGIINVVTEDMPDTDDPHEAKRKYYRLNEQSPLYPELRALLLKSHVLGEKSLRDDIAAAGDIALLLFTGSFTNAETPIDMLVVGAVPQKNIAALVADFEHNNGVSLRYAVMSLKEFQERKQLMDRFVYEIFDAPHEIAINVL